MAGIGFRLRKLFEHDTFFDQLRGVIFSAAIAGGPIFFSILCLVLLGIFSTAFISSQEMNLFLVTLAYIFAFSLIATGMTQLLVTRYLADQIYVEKMERILPSFSAVLMLTVLCQLAIALPFFVIWEISLFYKLSALMLFVVIGCNWQLLVFLSAMKHYRVVFLAFLFGLILSFFAAMFLGDRLGISGFLHGYTVGQIFLLFFMLARVFVEFKSDLKPDFGFLFYTKKVPQLLLIGLFYNLGIWIDKIIFWFSSDGHQVSSFLFAHTDYDAATFFSFLTTIPSYAYFLVVVETRFYGHFRAFFHSILKKQTYAEIESQKQHIGRVVRESLIGLVKLQGTITLLCLFFSEQLVQLLNTPVMSTVILEKALIAVFLQMLLLTVMIFLLYFDVKNEVVVVTSIFLAANVVLSYLTTQWGYVYYGYGYLAACLLALMVGYYYLNRHLKQLEYHTFISQPISV